MDGASDPAYGRWAHLVQFYGDARLGPSWRAGAYAGAMAARLGIVATLAANIAHGLGHGLISVVVGAWSAVALVGSYELLDHSGLDGGRDARAAGCPAPADYPPMRRHPGAQICPRQKQVGQL